MERNLLLLLLFLLAGCGATAVTRRSVGGPLDGFVTVRDGRFFCQGKPYRYVGTNFWYGPILASEGTGGDRERLARELDRLHALGTDNLRILVGADGGSRFANPVRPVLQPEPGVYNDTLLAGLDFLLAEMARRDMKAVLYLTNSWDWSGGFGFYLRATGHGDSPDAAGEGYRRYVDYAADFARDAAAQRLYMDHVQALVSRTNGLTGRAYRDDPTIMAWQICNEPRPFARNNKRAFAEWMKSTAALIKRIDPHHLVSTGSEGLYGCETDTALCMEVHADSCVDYLTVHVWPANWGWTSKDRLREDLPEACRQAGRYIDLHRRMAADLRKPCVIEEFGYPRDGNAFGPEATVEGRNAFFAFVFDRLLQDKNAAYGLSGCNFWGWGGSGRPSAERWQPGCDYLCDPPHEPQGWYSVFDCDTTTLRLVRRTVEALR